MLSTINSDTYWDKRFTEDWEVYEGPRQSRFFAQLALENLPIWLIEQIRRESLSVVDWGCAQGDGTDIWASYINSQQLFGVDFSKIAIEQASQRYPMIKFFCENWLEPDSEITQSYDVVFSSNTLEHFHNPFEVLATLSTKAKKAVILALPYREINRIAEHFSTFLSENIPLELDNGFRLVWSKVLDCSRIPSTQWSGDQVFLVYGDSSWIHSLQLRLSDCELEKIDLNTEFNILKQTVLERDIQIASLTRAVSDRDIQVASLTQAVTDRDLQVASLTQAVADQNMQIATLNQKIFQQNNQIQMFQTSRSWRLTRPLRLVYSLSRYIWSKDGRYLLLKAIYWKLPQALQDKLKKQRYAFAAKRMQHNMDIASDKFLNDDTNDYIEWVEKANKNNKVVIIPCGFEFDELVNQRPINAAKYFAEKGYQVLFIAWQWSAKDKLSKGCKEVFPNVFQVPLFDFIKYVNKLHLCRERSLFLVTMPTPNLVGLVPILREKGFAIIYDIMDEWEAFCEVGQAPWFKKSVEESLILQSDFVCAVSPPLRNKFSHIRSDIKIIGNGFTPEVLGVENQGIARNREDGGPIIGYFGHLTDAWFDWKLILQLAKSYPHIKFEIIGYGEPEWVRKEITALSNIHLLGKVLPKDLHRQVSNWSIGIIPFMEGILAEAVDPIKIYEYLYFGLPVVVTGIRHLKSYPMTYFAESEDVEDIIEKALNDDYDTEDINNFLQQVTWRARFETLINEINKNNGIWDLYAN